MDYINYVLSHNYLAYEMMDGTIARKGNERMAQHWGKSLCALLPVHAVALLLCRKEPCQEVLLPPSSSPTLFIPLYFGERFCDEDDDHCDDLNR